MRGTSTQIAAGSADPQEGEDRQDSDSGRLWRNNLRPESETAWVWYNKDLHGLFLVY